MAFFATLPVNSQTELTSLVTKLVYSVMEKVLFFIKKGFFVTKECSFVVQKARLAGEICLS